MQILRSRDGATRNEFRCYAIGEGVDVNAFLQNADHCITQANYDNSLEFTAKDREFNEAYGIPVSQLLLDLLHGVDDPQKLPNEVKYIELKRLHGGVVILSATYLTEAQRRLTITLLDLSQFESKADQLVSIQVAPESPHDSGPSIEMQMNNQRKIKVL